MTRKISNRQIERGKAYVEIGMGGQLAQVIRQTRRYRQDGYDVLPLDNGKGDPFGVYTTFVPETFARVADMSTWKREGNRWTKVTPPYTPSGDGDATGGGPYIPGSAIEEG